MTYHIYIRTSSTRPFHEARTASSLTEVVRFGQNIGKLYSDRVQPELIVTEEPDENPLRNRN